ncbi:MAG: PKD domain-containing protein [Phycisphaerae bacterium]|nr:PKD domain-containing protein [Phycisphaerae bacterium]
MKHTLAFMTAAALLLSIGGCPTTSSSDQTTDEAPITATIVLSATQGAAPFEIMMYGDSSSSTAGDIATYAWDIGGVRISTNSTVRHTFEDPGRYTISLTVTDTAGNQATAAATVRAQGDGAVEAVIAVDRDGGTAPLAVQFDGTVSTAENDTITDYYWDFNDGTTSANSHPLHIFESEGTYLVTLTATSGGGSEDSASIEITVGSSGGNSLQFAGSQYITLPVSNSDPLSACTFEAWIRAEDGSGIVASIGAQAMVISTDIDDDEISVITGSGTVTAIATGLGRVWRHVAVTYESGVTTSIYLDGLLLSTKTLTGDLDVSSLTVGQGFDGKIARIAFWASARTATQVAADANGAAPSGGTLLGYWPLDEGSGQYLGNDAGGTSGRLGLSSSVEAADPAWSSDGP